MDLPDGALCQITNSAKAPNPFIIVKLTDEELLNDSNKFPYKLVMLGLDPDECELSSSDMSSSEDEETKNTDLYLKSIEDSISIKSDSDKITETNNNVVKETSSDKSHKRRHYKEPRGSNHSRSNHRRRRIYKPSQGARSYNGSGSVGIYQNSSSKISARKNIEPWLKPLPREAMQPGFQFPTQFVNPLESHIQTNTNCELPLSVGLLGNSPYSPAPHQFHSPNQSNVYGPGQNYWEKKYDDYHSRSGPTENLNRFQRSGPLENSNPFQRLGPSETPNHFQRSGSQENPKPFRRSLPPGNSTNYQRSVPPDRPVSGRLNHRNNFKNRGNKHFRGNKSRKRFAGLWDTDRKEKGRDNSTSGYYYKN